MTDHRIKTFAVLCDCMNYRIAAERLHLTQPAVTQHIQYLEEYYHCRLFSYDRRNLTLTNAGEALRKYAENVLYQEKCLMQSLGAPEKTVLRMGATKTIGEYVIADRVERYLGYRENQLYIKVDNTEELLGLLKKGELDFALIEGYFDRSEFASKLFRREEFVGICSCDHQFACQTVSIKDIFDNTLFLRENGSGTRSIFEQFLASRNYGTDSFRRIVCINNFGLILSLIEKNCGITFGYSSLTVANSSLSAFRIAESDIFREYNYVFIDTPHSLHCVELFESFGNDIGNV